MDQAAERQETARQEKDQGWLQEQLRIGMGGGRFPADSWLRQDALAELYGVSRFVVRGALERLSEVGAIEHVPHRGYRVRRWSHQERLELTEARLVVELAMAPLMLARRTEPLMKPVRQACAQFEQAASECDGEAMFLSNHAFHRALAALACNRQLADQVNWLREQGMRGAGPGWPKAGGVERSIREHYALIEALDAGDVLGLQGVLQRHLTAWKERVAR